MSMLQLEELGNASHVVTGVALGIVPVEKKPPTFPNTSKDKAGIGTFENTPISSGCKTSAL